MGRVPGTYIGRITLNGNAPGGDIKRLKEAIDDAGFDAVHHDEARLLDIFQGGEP